MNAYGRVVALILLAACGGACSEDAADTAGRAGAASDRGPMDTLAAELPPPPDARERARICAGLDNTHRCARAIERRQLERTGARVQRTDGALLLALASGAPLRVPDDTLADWPSRYSYLGYVSPPGYYVLHAQHPEGNEIRIVQRETGWSRMLWNVPRPSPDGRRMAVASGGPYSDDLLSVFRVVADTLQLEWELRPRGAWAPEDAFWRDTLTLGLIRRYVLVCDGGEDASRYAYEPFWDTADVSHGGGEWTIEIPSVEARMDSMRNANPGTSCRRVSPG